MFQAVSGVQKLCVCVCSSECVCVHTSTSVGTLHNAQLHTPRCFCISWEMLGA